MRFKNIYFFSFVIFTPITSIDAPADIPPRTPAEHIITFFIRPCFCSNECVDRSNFTEALSDPGFLNRNHLAQCLKRTRYQGINVVYNGFTTHTDAHGQVRFPRLKESDTITLIVTNKPQPLITQGVTVNKWTVDEGTPVAVYTYTRTNFKDTEVWVTEKHDVPPHFIIPTDAIIIIADPNEIIIHEGISSTIPGPNIVLPTVYTKKSINLDKDALLFLNINRYFAEVRKVVNYSQDRYAVNIQS